MVFASHSFLAFLAIVVLGYWLVGRSDERLGKPLLIVASFVFYGYWIPAYQLLLGVSILKPAAAQSVNILSLLNSCAMGQTANVDLFSAKAVFAALIQTVCSRERMSVMPMS